MRRAIPVSRIRRTFASLGCILIGLPGLFLASPLLAGPQPTHLHLRIDLSDLSDWRVDWWQDGHVLPRAGEWQAEPFLHEGLARLQRLWPEGPRQASLDPRASPLAKIDDAETQSHAAGRRGAFRLRPVVPGEGLDQSFAFPAQASGMLRIEIVGLTPATSLEFSGLDIADHPVEDGTIRLHGLLSPAPSLPNGFASPLRLTLSGHRDLAALGRAVIAPFGRTPPRTDIKTGRPERATLLALLDALDDDPGNGYEPLLGRSIAEAGPLHLDGNRVPGPLDRAIMLSKQMAERGWQNRLWLTNRRHLLGLPLRPAFLFDTVLVEAPEAGLLIDPVNGLLLDADAPHLELGGKSALVIAEDSTELRSFRSLRPADYHLVVHAEMNLDHSGQTEGQSLTEAHGAARPLLVQLIRRLSERRGRAHDMMQKQGFAGTMRIGFSEQSGTRVRQHLAFEFARMPGISASESVQASIGPRLFRPPLASLMPVLRARAEGPVSCHPLRLEQTLVLHLPDARSLLDVPPDLRVEGLNGFYEARYRIEPGHLHVERLLEFDPPGPLCSAELVREMAPVLRAAGRDLDRALNVRRLP